jgi:branched-chain amino acid transport system substrate-binding protein
MVTKRLSLWLGVLAAASILGACGSDESGGGGDDANDPLVIGYAAGLTGDAAFYDVSSRAGAEYAVDELNQAGGVDGHEVELLVKDMKSDPKLSEIVAQELIEDGAQVLLGAPFPDQNAGTIRAGGAAGIPTVLVSATDPNNLVVGGRVAYFTAFGDNQQAAAAAEYALGEGAKTAMTISSPDTGYTRNNPIWFTESFEAGGGEVVGDAQFSLGQQDFAPIADSVVDANPDVVYTSMFLPDTPVFLKALEGAGYEGDVMGADGFDTPELLSVAGSAAENVTFTAHGFPEPGGKLAAVIDGIEKEQGDAPDAAAFAGLGYDAVQLIAAAAEEAGAIDAADLDAALAELPTVDGATGSITLEGTNGIPTKDVFLVEVENGEFALADQFIPENVPEAGG